MEIRFYHVGELIAISLVFDFHIGPLFKYFILYYKTLHDIRFEQHFHI